MPLQKLVPDAPPSGSKLPRHQQLYEHYNSAKFDFDIHSVTTKDDSICWLVSHPQMGQFLVGQSDKPVQITRPEAIG